MKLKNILLLLIPCIIALSCKKQDIQTYNSDIAGVYFWQLDHLKRLTDSAHFSFADVHSTVEDTILRVPVMTQGKLKDYPRTFKVTADQAKSTAIEGTHYEIDHSSSVIPAGTGDGYAHVKFKRTDEMKNSQFRLVLKLEDNEHFKFYLKKQRDREIDLNARLIDPGRFTITVNDILTEPNSWKFLRGTGQKPRQSY